VELLSGFEDEGVEGLDDGRALVADVALGGVFEGFDRASLKEGAELVEANRFADVELQENQYGPLERGVRRCGFGHGGNNFN